jgi:hypothetical protein
MTAVLWIPETPPAGEWEVLRIFAERGLVTSLMQRAVILNASSDRSERRGS